MTNRFSVFRFSKFLECFVLLILFKSLATAHRVMSSGWRDEERLIRMNYRLDEIEKIGGSKTLSL